MVTNLNWVKMLSSDQRTAQEYALLSRHARKKKHYKISKYFQEKAAAEYEACRSVYQLLFQESDTEEVEINHD